MLPQLGNGGRRVRPRRLGGLLKGGRETALLPQSQNLQLRAWSVGKFWCFGLQEEDESICDLGLPKLVANLLGPGLALLRESVLSTSTREAPRALA